ncbi:hypothetical protein SAMN05421833_12955 [Microbispora rosea]|uniref:Uncharacterized protein n=1 Tax=Microbispora rosea TaxID=58117 RepID=A0A1N7GI95_9ACTN|nr:hypothetical protein [Microbispora rosea]GIH51643.1 hypothetical protein Mro03_68220 [Microbispora rosea subsp. rosea]SIS12325.1 hypothetical protein SAMN05421833_12955 [Microbispora rosea]
MNHLVLRVPQAFGRWGVVIVVVIVVLYILVLTGTKIELGIGPAV